MKTFKALGALLLYPTADLKSALPEIAQTLEEEGLLARAEQAGLGRLVGRLSEGGLYDLEEDYCRLFDRTRSLSLHLYEHVHGEARERGQAMVRLQTVYSLHGFAHTESELPDYLPLFCEFLSLVPERAARSLLADAAPVLEALRERLERRSSAYAAVMGALVALSARKVDRALLEAISRGESDEDGDDLEAIDRAWEEAPVTFGGGAALCGGAAFDQHKAE